MRMAEEAQRHGYSLTEQQLSQRWASAL